jgi:hypothetical protein
MPSRTKTKAKRRNTPPIRNAGMDALPTDPPPLMIVERTELFREPSPAEIQALDQELAREEARTEALGLARQYPKTNRERSVPLAAALKHVPGLTPARRKVIAQVLSVVADAAHDLEEIVERLLKEKHTAAEIGELLLAIPGVAEHLRTYTESLEGKVREIFDQLHGLDGAPPVEKPARQRGKQRRR